MKDLLPNIRVKLEGFEEDFAILFYENEMGKTARIRWPQEYIPQYAKPGETFFLKLTTEKMEQEEKYARMRRLLEDLIN